jgi:hypothetical protein
MTASALPGRYAIYTGRATNWPMVILSVVLAMPLLVMANAGDDDWRGLVVPWLVVALGVLLTVLTGSSVRTTAGPNGVSVRFGLFGWPRATYRLEQIERAEVVDLPFWYVAYGFWWTPGRTCCTIRSGPTLRLTLRTGRTVTITVPDPQAAVAAVQEAR